MKNKTGNDWDAYYAGNFIQRRWKRKIAEAVYHYAPPEYYNVQPSLSVLDIGCGSSPLSVVYANRVGLDRDYQKIDFIRERSLMGSYEVHDVSQPLPFPALSQSLVLCIELIEHLEPPVANFLIAEISRVLKPGGLAIIATPDYSKRRWKILESIYQTLLPGRYCDDHINPMTEAGLTAMCEPHKLTLVESRRVFGCDLVALFHRRVVEGMWESEPYKVNYPVGYGLDELERMGYGKGRFPDETDEEIQEWMQGLRER